MVRLKSTKPKWAACLMVLKPSPWHGDAPKGAWHLWNIFEARHKLIKSYNMLYVGQMSLKSWLEWAFIPSQLLSKFKIFLKVCIECTMAMFMDPHKHESLWTLREVYKVVKHGHIDHWQRIQTPRGFFSLAPFSFSLRASDWFGFGRIKI